MTTNRLTDLKIKALSPASREYMQSDGEGLNLVISPNGNKTWRLAYRHLGQQKRLTFGPYPKVGLAEARTMRDDAKAKLREGHDPALVKRETARQRREDTFKALAGEWFESQKSRWNEDYASLVWTRVEDDVIPHIGHLPVREIEPPEILSVIRRVEDRGAVTLAKRIKQYCSKIFQFAIAEARCVRDPTADITAALKPAPKVRHRASLCASELPNFFSSLREYDGDETVKFALWLIAYTFPRTQELRYATKSEFQLGGAHPVWRVPGERMKMKEAHLVPLAPAVVVGLEAYFARDLHPTLLFPSWGKTGVISENAMLYALYRMGYHSRATVHGFRSTASTVLNESGKFKEDWIEMQLAHDERDDTRAAYNNAKYLQHRRRMMVWYAEFLKRQEETAAILG